MLAGNEEELRLRRPVREQVESMRRLPTGDRDKNDELREARQNQEELRQERRDEAFEEIGSVADLGSQDERRDEGRAR